MPTSTTSKPPTALIAPILFLGFWRRGARTARRCERRSNSDLPNARLPLVPDALHIEEARPAAESRTTGMCGMTAMKLLSMRGVRITTPVPRARTEC